MDLSLSGQYDITQVSVATQELQPAYTDRVHMHAIVMMAVCKRPDDPSSCTYYNLFAFT